MTIRTLIIFTVFFFPLAVFSERSNPANAFDHKNRGCLPNSICSKKFGLSYLKWTRLLEKKDFKSLNKMVNEGLYPFDIWSLREENKKNDSMFWKSVCHSHNKKNLFMGKLFIKNADNLKMIPLKNAKKTTPYFSDAILTRINSSLKIHRYAIPKDETPTALSGNKLHFTLGEGRLYYNLSIDHLGNLTVYPVTSTDRIPYSESCPKDLMAEYKKTWKDSQIKTSFYCRSLFNSKTNKFQTLLVVSYCK